MFNDNWYLFLLIVMLSFVADGDVNNRESAVMLSILFALTLTENPSLNTANANSFNRYCNT